MLRVNKKGLCLWGNQNGKMMSLFTELLKDSYKGCFVYEPNELTEVRVNYGEMRIDLLKFRTKKDLTPLEKVVYHSLHGMFGNQTVEEKFNQIIKSI
jgi:hypothetical protein